MTFTALVLPLILSSPANRVVPGVLVGHIRLGENLTEVSKILGEANGPGDAAMGHVWRSWLPKSGKAELDVYTVRGENDSARNPENFVRQIRVSSPFFRTSEGIHAGSSLTQIRHFYPSIEKLRKAQAAQKNDFYDSKELGIAFEVKESSCVSLVVHSKGKGLLNEYIPPTAK